MGVIHLTKNGGSPPGNKIIHHVTLILLTPEINLDQIFENVNHNLLMLY